jgi:HlyD family secretion protein
MVRVFTDLRVLASIALTGGLLTVAMWPKTVLVDVARVVRGPLVVTVDEEGRTRVRDRFLIAAPVAGRVLRIELDPGDRVSRGDVVARLQPVAPPLLDARRQAEAVAELNSAEASLGGARADQQEARAALSQAQRDLLRGRHLIAAGATTAADLDARETEAALKTKAAETAAFVVRAAEADVTRARARLATSVSGDTDGSVMVKAPIDGVVLRRFRDSESSVPAGAPLIEIGDLRQLEIVTDLLSSDAVFVKPGAAASIPQWGGDVTLAATVRRIEPAGFTKVSALGVEEQRVNIVLDFEETGEDDVPLGDAYRVDTRIVLSEAADVLKVPTNALLRDGARWAVYVVNAGRARRTIVELGRHTGLEAEVTLGLSVGATVVVHPSDLLHDGVRIAARAGR